MSNPGQADVEQRFNARIDRSGECHVWTGSLHTYGYGLISVGGRLWGTHRLAWVLANGPIPQGAFVLHRCDNPPCVRVDHLFLGTPADNMKDMIQKGRGAKQKITHCPQGHEYTPENTRYISYGRQRHCRTCERARGRVKAPA